MTADERRLIAAAADPLADFYRVWTVREAFSKQVGLGLPLYDNEKVTIDYERGTIDHRGGRYAVRSFMLDGHMLSVCVRGEMSDIKQHIINKEEWEGYFSR